MSATRFSLRNPISRRSLPLNKAGLVAYCGTVTNCKEHGDFLSIHVQSLRVSRHFPPFTKLTFRYRILKDPLLVPALCCILRGPGVERIVNVVPGGTELELQVIIIIILLLLFIKCNWVVTRWQWLFYMYMYTKYEIGY